MPGEAALYELIGAIRARRGCGVLMISHDLHVVMAATDRIVCLNRHVCCAGTPEAVSRHPEYARLFGRAAATALAVYTHHHDHRHGFSGEVVHLSSPGVSARPPEPRARQLMQIDRFFCALVAAGIGVATVAGPIGCFVVWRRMAYFGDTMAHSALLGVVIGLLFSVNMTDRRHSPSR